MNLFFNNNQKRPRAGWRLLSQFILFFFFVSFALLGFNALWQSSLSITSALPQLLASLASIWIAARLLDKRSLSDYGLSIGVCWWKDCFAGIFIAGIAMGSIFIIEWQLGWLSVTGFGWESPSAYSFPIALASSLGAMFMVGFYEEAVFRGYQLLNLSEGLHYPALGNRGAVIIATLSSSTLFGLMHAFNPNASAVGTFNIILAGIVLAIPYVLTGRLGLSVGLHFSWNFVQGSVFGFPVSGTQLDASVINIMQKGPDWLTGGAFGPEAGGLGILGMCLMVVGTYGYMAMSSYPLSIAALFKRPAGQVPKSDEQAL